MARAFSPSQSLTSGDHSNVDLLVEPDSREKPPGEVGAVQDGGNGNTVYLLRLDDANKTGVCPLCGTIWNAKSSASGAQVVQRKD